MRKNTQQYYDYLNVPVQLCAYALKERKENHILLYLYLKSISNGYIKNKNEIYTKAAQEIGVCVKTIKNHRNWLIDIGLLIPDVKVKSIRIISFELLAQKLEFLSATGVLVYKSDIKNFKSIAVAAVIEYLMMRVRRREKVTELKMWSSQSHDTLRYPHLPHNYLAKVLNKSKTAAYRFKKIATKNRYIKIKKRYQDMQIGNVDINLLKIHGPFNPDKLKKSRGRIISQLPDEIQCMVTLRRKDNLRIICQINRERKKS